MIKNYFLMLRLFVKNFFFVNVKAKYLFVETKMQGMDTEKQRLGEAARGAETVSRGLEAILRILRLWRLFHRANGGPAPPPSS